MVRIWWESTYVIRTGCRVVVLAKPEFLELETLSPYGTLSWLTFEFEHDSGVPKFLEISFVRFSFSWLDLYRIRVFVLSLEDCFFWRY